MQYEKAASYHLKHAELADVEGKFIAYTNLGLLYATLGKWADAAKTHKVSRYFDSTSCVSHFRLPSVYLKKRTAY